MYPVRPPKIYVHERVHLSNDDIIAVEAAQSFDGAALVVILTDVGAE